MIVRFFRSSTMSDSLGEVEDHVVAFPGEFVQLTKQVLRDFDGNDIAWYDHMRGVWCVPVDRNTEVIYSDAIIAHDASPIAIALEA